MDTLNPNGLRDRDIVRRVGNPDRVSRVSGDVVGGYSQFLSLTSGVRSITRGAAKMWRRETEAEAAASGRAGPMTLALLIDISRDSRVPQEYRDEAVRLRGELETL